MKMPDREYYTLQELVDERWIDATAGKIEHYIDTDRLEARYIGAGYPRSPDNVIVDRVEVERFEKDNGMIDGNNNEEAQATPYLDPNHVHYSKELAVAVKTWLALYGTRATFNPKKGHKTQIKAALTGNGFSSSAIDRISTVINPNKEGGAPIIE